MVLPWHPRWQRSKREGGVHFHLFRYAPHPSLGVFGYAGALRADVDLRGSAYVAAPLALATGIAAARRVARAVKASVMHGHWVVPGGAMAALAARSRPLVVSLHGSDVYVAERSRVAGRVARWTFGRAGWVTACSADLRTRAHALGADPARSEVVPYGVDGRRFAPSPDARREVRRALGLTDATPLVFTVGRFARKKGFEFLIDAAAPLTTRVSDAVIVIGGDGDLRAELEARAAAAGVAGRVRFPGLLPQDAVSRYLSAADVVVVPSVRDDAGNVDGLPNVVMETLASGTPIVATPAGGIGAVVVDGVNGLLVPERDAVAIAAAAARLLTEPGLARRIGDTARARALAEHGWDRVAGRFEAAYREAILWKNRST
jgi:glycosyltransferase involved in cell wall biosynthesis